MRALPTTTPLRYWTLVLARLARLTTLCYVLLVPVAGAIDANARAPDFTLSGALSQQVQLAALRGKLVYLDFWASWCAPCRRSFPWMNAMQEKYGPRGLVVVGVNVDQRRPDAERFLTQVPANFTIAYDSAGAVPKLYAITAMPSSILIDPQGRVLSVHAGFRDEERDDVEAKIVAALPPRAN
jgi:thiol-disulfide isomerase/thioredoxin